VYLSSATGRQLSIRSGYGGALTYGNQVAAFAAGIACPKESPLSVSPSAQSNIHCHLHGWSSRGSVDEIHFRCGASSGTAWHNC
jgi:hypothetical protein